MLSNYHIEIRELKVACRVGHTAEERSFPRLINFNLDLELELGKSFESDELKDALDYRMVVSTLQRMAGECQWSLMEKLCADLGREILALHPAIQAVHVAALKPIFPEAQGVGVRLTLARG